jgi:hypothetical protein
MRSPIPILCCLAAACLWVALAVAGCGSSPAPDHRSASGTDPAQAAIPWLVPERPIPGLRRRTVGAGPGGAVVLWAAGSAPPARLVIFLHPWQPLPPFTQGPWLRHLAREGATIVYPAYQARGTPSRDFLGHLLSGVAAALRAFPDAGRAGALAVGRTTGGALAFDYAAAAAAHGLPVPGAVLAVFPGREPPSGRIAPADLARIPADTTLEVIAGPGDPLPDGRREARRLLAAATAVPPRRRRLLRPAFPPDVPRTPAAAVRAAERRAFWRPADRLIAEVEGR